MEKKKSSHSPLVDKCKLVQPLWKTGGMILKKLRIGLPYDPATPCPGIYLKNSKTFITKIYAPLISLQHYTVAKP